MDKFSSFNPKVCFLFFVFAVILILLNFNPFFLSVSLLAGLIYNFMLQGKKAVLTFVTFLLPFTLLVALFNMVFPSYGVDVLFPWLINILHLKAFFTDCARVLCFQA